MREGYLRCGAQRRAAVVIRVERVVNRVADQHPDEQHAKCSGSAGAKSVETDGQFAQTLSEYSS
jgi:hypothetical protein